MVFAVSFEHFMTFRRTVISNTTTALQLTLFGIKGMRLINITICRDILSILARAFGKRFWPAQS